MRQLIYHLFKGLVPYLRKRFPTALVACALLHTATAQYTLTYFLESARKNNPVGALDSLQGVANRLGMEQQKAALTGPQLSLDGAYLAAPVVSTDDGRTRFLLNPGKSTSEYYGYDLALTNGGLYRGAVVLEQPLLTAPRVHALDIQTQLKDQQLAQHTRFTYHQLDKAITDQYLLCHYILTEQEATHELLRLIEAQQAVSQTLARNALLYRADVQLLNIEAERLHTTLYALGTTYNADLLDLYTLCGITDTTTTLLTPAGLLPDKAIPASSGFTAAFRLDSVALTVDQQLFDLRYQPQLSFFTSAGLDASYAPDIARRFGWQAGLRFTQVLFDGHQRQINDRRVRLLAQGTATQTNFFLNQNQVRKTKLRTQILALDTQDTAVRRQRAGYDTLLDLYRQQVIAGQLSVINYLTVLRSRAALQQDLATIAYNRELLINEYNYWNW
jgi:hypothetical protein